MKNENSVYISDETQEGLILGYLLENDHLTTLEAIKKLGILQSPARIWGLKRKGINIKTRPTTVLNRDGKARRIVQYFIPKDEPIYTDDLVKPLICRLLNEARKVDNLPEQQQNND